MDFLGISKVGQTVLARLMGLRYGTSLPTLGGEGLEKGQWSLLALMPDSSVSPFMALVLSKLLPWHWKLGLEGLVLALDFLLLRCPF